MKRWLYYHLLALRDLYRLWSSTQHHVIIIAGICLPILLLLGLKRGHVAELRAELLSSPTGRQIQFFSARRGELLDLDGIDRLSREVPGTSVIIPDAHRLVQISVQTAAAVSDQDSDNPILEPLRVTLYGTRPGDPLLGQYDADVIRDREHAIVLTKETAETLGATLGDQLSVTIERGKQDNREEAAFDVELKAVVPGSSEGELVGYANTLIVDALEQYVRGFAVRSMNWSAMKSAGVPSRYSAYIMFCFKGGDTELVPEDRRFLEERGLTVTRVNNDQQLMTLYGLLQADRLSELSVYLIKPADAAKDPTSLIHLKPLYITTNTRAVDDFIVRWNPPRSLTVNGKSLRVIGVSLPTLDQEGGWIRDFLIENAPVFDYRHSLDRPASIRAFGPARLFGKPIATVSLRGDDELELTVVDAEKHEGTENKPTCPKTPVDDDSKKEATKPSTTETKSSEAVAVVPAPLLAMLNAYQRDEAIFDAASGRFAPKPEPTIYAKNTLYTGTIDEVPEAVGFLRDLGFSVQAQESRITEIHEQDASLQLLVLVVGTGVFGFGVVTVFSVLMDSTDRKRGTIGILRVMGVSQLGVFYLVVFRAMVIGILAAALCTVTGYTISAFLAWTPTAETLWIAWKPAVNISIAIDDIGVMCAGALLCSCCGALWPGWKASSLDPFDAIVQGRFH